MDRHPSFFPAGFAGQGLLLLRGVVALALLLCITGGKGPVVHAVVIGATALIVIGLCTRWSALAATATIIATSDWQLGGLLVAALALALALTGPGSLSLDARLFGRRRIRLAPERHVDERDDA